MTRISQSLRIELSRLVDSPVEERTLPSLRELHSRLMDLADSLVPKGPSEEQSSDFEDAIDQFTETVDELDAACDHFDMAEDEDEGSREEALENAGKALADLAGALRELEPLAEYIETSTESVAARWGGELARLGYLPPEQGRDALEALLN